MRSTQTVDGTAGRSPGLQAMRELRIGRIAFPRHAVA